LQELIRLVREAAVGDTVAVMADDPDSRVNIPAWVAKAGYRLDAMECSPDDTYRFVVTRTH
jgi:TusA-related sulfurtransferase